MNQTNGDSEKELKEIVVCADIFENDPNKTNDKYKILTGKNIHGKGDITGIGPGAVIPVKDGIEVDKKTQEEILKKQEERRKRTTENKSNIQQR